MHATEVSCRDFLRMQDSVADVRRVPSRLRRQLTPQRLPNSSGRDRGLHCPADRCVRPAALGAGAPMVDGCR